MSRWLVTGGSGFLGRHVLAHLRREIEAGDVVVVGRRVPPGVPESRFHRIDLADRPEPVSALLDSFRPDVVLHLAGRTPPADSATLERESLVMAENLLNPLTRRGEACRVVLAGSAAEYGPVSGDELPVGEERACQPSESYGIGKLRAWERAWELARGTALRLTNARLFNLVGPGMPASQAFGRFAELLAAGSGPITLQVGELNTRRDFVDVRDAARAVVRLGRTEPPGPIVNIATGRSHTIHEGLQRLIELSGREVRIERDPEQAARPGPVDFRGRNDRLRATCGWVPLVSLRQSLADLWRATRSPD